MSPRPGPVCFAPQRGVATAPRHFGLGSEPVSLESRTRLPRLHPNETTSSSRSAAISCKLSAFISAPALSRWKTTDGIFHAQIGQVGKPGSQTFDGTIAPDGTADIFQKGWSGDSRRDPFHRPIGTEYNNTYLTKFDGSKGNGTRSNRPSCKVDFTKR